MQKEAPCYRITLVEDDPIVVLGLRSWLQSIPNMHITQSITRQQFQKFPRKNTNSQEIILFKAFPSLLQDIIYFRTLGTNLAQYMCLLVGDYDEFSSLRELFQLGKKGYISRNALNWEIIAAFKRVVQNGYYIDPCVCDSLIFPLAHQQKSSPESFQAFGLTSKEHELLYYLSKGCTNKEIAQQLHLAETTIRNYLSNLYKKIHVAHRSEAVLFAFQHMYPSECARLNPSDEPVMSSAPFSEHVSA
jgi:DNA-binding NarL/FixJ family response regulator